MPTKNFRAGEVGLGYNNSQRSPSVTFTIDSLSGSPSPSTVSTVSTRSTRKEKRHQTLYDAVANKSREDRFLDVSKVNRRTGRIPTTRAVGPESILAHKWRSQTKTNRKGDEEYEDLDVKLMQAGLVVPSQRSEALPDSDLLEALHVYISDFFHHEGLEEICSQHFDDTALLAMGILIEELVTECLGENGHKMFMEDNAENESEESPSDGNALDDTQETQQMEAFEEYSGEETVEYPSNLQTKEPFEEDMDSQSDFY